MSDPVPQLPPTLFIGAGRMASAIVGGLLSAGRAKPADLRCTCGADPTGPDLAARTGIGYAAGIGEALDGADLVLLACKPQQLAELPEALAGGTAGKLVLSILAGTTLERLRTVAPAARNVVRIMPNTPAQVGKGVSAYASAAPLADGDLASVEILLSAMGDFVAVPESDLDAVTALSGSGPAYVFEFVRVLAAAGEDLGLAPEVAARLARRTLTGSAALLEARSEASPAALVREVTSPGGTTEAALARLEGRFQTLLTDALHAARDRSRELAQG